MKAYLIFEDGIIFEGERIGANVDAIGEAAFTTAMGGFVETLSDPACCGGLVVQTFPMVGNYGANLGDAESKVFAAGYVVREICQKGSNFRKQTELNDFLTEKGIAGISGVDTREITRKILGGSVRAMITDSTKDLQQKIARLKGFKPANCLSRASTSEVTRQGEGKRVVLWDLGAKDSIARELAARGCEVIRVPFDFTAEQIAQYKPQGVVLAGGCSPEGNKDIAQQILKLTTQNIPMLGIGLGHLLMYLAVGGKIKKLRRGHRGSNQPVKDLQTGRVYITAQNHGHAVTGTLPKDKVEIRFVNANDKTCEGLVYKEFPAVSVQFDPCGCAGPKDSAFVLDEFIKSL